MSVVQQAVCRWNPAGNERFSPPAKMSAGLDLNFDVGLAHRDQQTPKNYQSFDTHLAATNPYPRPCDARLSGSDGSPKGGWE